MAQDAAMLLITCTCGQRMKVPSGALGKTATCVKCGDRLRITVDATEPQAPPAMPAASEENSQSIPEGEFDIVHLLKQHGLVTDEAINETLLVYKDLPKKIWELLIELGHISSEDFHAVMAKQKGMASMDLLNYTIPVDVKKVVPGELVRRGVFVPVDCLGKLVTLAMACPLDTGIIAEVEDCTGLRVKRMLCSFADLKQTIISEYSILPPFSLTDDPIIEGLQKEFGPLLERNEIARRVFELDAMPASSQTATELKTALEAGGNGTTLRSVTEIIANDPIAAATLLRVSNSDTYGFAGRVDGLGLACTLLGANAAQTIIESGESDDYMQRSDGFNYEGLWRRAQFCAESAQSIADAVKQRGAITAYTAALMHQIGRLAFMAVAPNSYPAITAGLTGQRLAEAEQRVYHITGEELGYLLTRRWNLPENITHSIRYQHHPEKATKARDVSAIVALAVRMSEAHYTNENLSLDSAESALATLELTSADIGTIFREMSSSQA